METRGGGAFYLEGASEPYNHGARHAYLGDSTYSGSIKSPVRSHHSQVVSAASVAADGIDTVGGYGRAAQCAKRNCAAASAMTFATSRGRDNIGTWLEASASVFAFMRAAESRCTAGGIM